jgi:hypothetical protein
MVNLSRVWRYAAFALAVFIGALEPTGGSSQTSVPTQSGPGGAAPGPMPAEKPPAGPAKARVQVPLDQALLLVRSTLLTLNDANHSGNYTVLRDLASQEFQAKNTSADLALVFAEMRKSNLSLFSVMLLSPQLSAAPDIDAEGRLRISGYVLTSPQQVKFDLLYESSSRKWKLLNINISTTPVQAASPPSLEQKEPRKQVQKAKLPSKPPAPRGAPPKSEAATTQSSQGQGASSKE